MAYAVTGDLVKYVGRGDKLLAATSPVSVADLEQIIDDIAYEIDGMLPTIGVTAVPVVSGDSPKAYDLLRRLNAIGAAAFAELRLFGEGAPGARGTSRHEILLAEYHRMFEAIRMGQLSLSDVEGGAISEDVLAFSGAYRDAEGNVKEPFFTRTQKF